MPTFFFVLMRYFLRVDGVIFRLYETRLFHEFDQKNVIREVTRKEATYETIATVSLSFSQMILIF
jgi:type 2A phosphatase activator TIP41